MGKHIDISLDQSSGGLTLEVQDDGVGLPDDACLRGGLGLGTMNYRAKMIGAKLSITRGIKGGTVVRCSVRDTAEIAKGLRN